MGFGIALIKNGDRMEEERRGNARKPAEEEMEEPLKLSRLGINKKVIL